MKKMRMIVPHPSLFKRSDIDVAILSLGKSCQQRSHEFTYGLDAVCDELSVNVHKIVTPKTIDDCEIALCSLCSVRDTLAFACRIKKRPKSRLIVGGQGVYPFLSWRHLTYRIAFGRVEDAVDTCILDNTDLPFCYDFSRDAGVSRKYQIRQARRLLRGEQSVGCHGACKFCQYSATRTLFGGSDYAPSKRGSHIVEDRWQYFPIKTGQVMTALDGLSEKTRKKVGKPISDLEIVEKLSQSLFEINGIMRLKVFMIVGYPWETPESVKADLLRLREILGRVRRGRAKSRIMMMLTWTPFSPEPLTAMEDDPANVEVNWRDIILHDDFRCIYDSEHLNAFSLPQVPGPLTLYKRVAVNRGASLEKLIQIERAQTIEEAIAIGGDLHKKGAGIRVSKILEKEKIL